jgi:hypothetical protein
MAGKQRVSDDTAQEETFLRLNVKVTRDAYERLQIHAVKARRPPGELIVELINAHLREWSMPGANSPGGRKARRGDLADRTVDAVAG